MFNLKDGCLILVICISTAVVAQPGNPVFGLSTEVSLDLDMRSIAIMDLESSGLSTDFTLTLPTPIEAGDALGTNPLLTNDENWLNYSCANRDISSRHIDVSISAGSVPAALELKLDVGTSGGMSGGITGTPTAGSITLGPAAQSVVTGIEGSYTGDGPFNGHQLTYSLHYLNSDFHNLTIRDQDITIAFTLVDD